jgi:hypothetical protein
MKVVVIIVAADEGEAIMMVVRVVMAMAVVHPV